MNYDSFFLYSFSIIHIDKITAYFLFEDHGEPAGSIDLNGINVKVIDYLHLFKILFLDYFLFHILFFLLEHDYFLLVKMIDDLYLLYLHEYLWILYQLIF